MLIVTVAAPIVTLDMAKQQLVDKSHLPLRDATHSPIQELKNEFQVEKGVVTDLLPGLISAPTVIWAIRG